MTLAALIRGARAADSGKSATATPATPATLEGARGRSVATVETVAVANPQESEFDTLSDPAAEPRRQRALAKLAAKPGIYRAVIVDDWSDVDAVIVTVALRGVGTADVRIPRNRYDPFLFLEAVERQSVH